MSVPLWGWLAVLAVIAAMLAVDLLAHRTSHVISVREATAWSVGWITLGLAFGGLVWWQYGGELGSQYFAGYLIEKTLAVDNVFVFALIFTFFAVPREHQHRVLFYGVVGALVFRGAFIAAGSALIASAAWILYVFGAFLVLTGWRMAKSRHQHPDPSNGRTVRLFQRHVPTTLDYHGARFWVRIDGRLLADLVDRFVHLKLGLAIVLVWVGLKLLLLDVWKIPTLLSLGVVVVVIAGSIVASLRATRAEPAVDLTPPDPSVPLDPARPATTSTGGSA